MSKRLFTEKEQRQLKCNLYKLLVVKILRIQMSLNDYSLSKMSPNLLNFELSFYRICRRPNLIRFCQT